MLNPQQFKISLGSPGLDARASSVEASIRGRKAVKGPTEDAPHGYYNQPSSNVRQQALPGMEMSVQDHLDALGKATGAEASIESGWVSHRISLGDRAEGLRYPIERSHLSYSNERPAEGVRDNGETVGAGHPQAYHPGEIRMVKSGRSGDANAMLETAERLAAEHGMAYPKHSWDRTGPGVAWSQKMMKKRGEQVW